MISRHAKNRLNERVGVVSDSLVAKALEYGISQSDCTGTLKRFLDGFYLKYKKPRLIKVYGEHVYLFSQDHILITVIPLPNRFKKAIQKKFKQTERKG